MKPPFMNLSKLLQWLSLFIFLVSFVSCAAPKSRTPNVSEIEIEREAYRQRVLVLKSKLSDRARLMDIAFRLKRGAACLCDKKAICLDFMPISKDMYRGEYKETAINLFDLGELSKIVHVVKGSPADEAGLRKGDEILSIEGRDFPTKPNAIKKLMESLREAPALLEMRILRNGQRVPIRIHPSECCDYDVELIESDQVNVMPGLMVKKYMSRKVSCAFFTMRQNSLLS
ncbi:MAG: hypothetical protein DRH12_10095 [Deltaproteobacteria bacterium]|nr:MAG: hypothetical protein DRH12_10095 [Deltaproteobacteria bacterium]